MSLVWMPDGTRLFSGGDVIREWDSSTWKQIIMSASGDSLIGEPSPYFGTLTLHAA
ncbi:hypothetical protein AZE42_01036 [Rhizopogon vesiculosus]|uniref:Uncharacterized protein n=1 Tax=Rhizopogon vesiculosus TaxID=180088 RepID=A0A1J8PSF1_9AGAM|nr:hypothetical protein AZE42_01036 [Rhizopogon vesiculosus]